MFESLETEIGQIVEKKLNEKQIRIEGEEVEDIVKSLIPELDKIVSKVVIKHIREIAQYVLDNFKEKE